MTDQYRIIGKLEGQMESAEERLNRIETKLDVLMNYIQQQKGGAKLIWAIATAGGIIGVSIMKLGSLLTSMIRGTP
jgi:tetrahydromethanopterin S-methyltransferase subunit G